MIALMIGSILLNLWFLWDLGYPNRSVNPSGAWLWAGMGFVTLALDILLMLVLLRIPFSPLLAIAVLFAQDGVYTWRLVVLRQARRDDKEIG